MAEIALDPRLYDAAVFDMDGVVTDTASVHERAWRETFDRYLERLAVDAGTTPDPFTAEDYLSHVDGKPRFDGVRAFLASRGIELPEETEDGSPSVRGIGDEKNALFGEMLESGGATALPGVREFVSALTGAGIRVAVISASRNAPEVLESAGVAGLFETRVDGNVANELGLAGKPDPAVFLEAARRLGAEPGRTIVLEDALAGVEAGRSGGFGLVVGVDRGAGEADLRSRGADAVVTTLEEFRVLDGFDDTPRTAPDVPGIVELWPALARGLPPRRPLAVFLDYDGTLTPIVERPEDALLGEKMREQIAELAASCFVAVVSGRDASFVVEQVGLDSVTYLGSHGFDVVAPAGRKLPADARARFERFESPLQAAGDALERELAEIEGAQVERKRFAIAIHYRRAAEESLPVIKEAVEREAARHDELVVTGGKKIFELRPAVDWNKGTAVAWVLESFGLADDDTLPAYVGDDVTDEDAFEHLAAEGITVMVVSGESRETRARFTVTDTDQVATLLGLMAARCAPPDDAG